MPYYVVNVGRGRSSTHIVKSGSATLCGLTASRYVDVFGPSEASCRECKKRWQLAVAAEAAEAARAPEILSPSGEKARPRAVTLFALGVGWIGASVIIGIGAVAVYAPCAKPYAECAANGHLGALWGGLLLFILTAVIGLGGLVMFIASLLALFKPKSHAVPRRTKDRRA